MNFPSDHRADRVDVTRLLSASASGSSEARDHLVEILHKELHAMASIRMRSERPDHTLGATALVNEAIIRLFKPLAHEEGDTQSGIAPVTLIPWHDRNAFFASAATVMRRILVDHARTRNAQKRGGAVRSGSIRVEADAVAAAQTLDPAEFLALDEAMEHLSRVDPRAAQVTQLRFFAGLDVDEVAEILDVSSRTVKRDWMFAKAWLHNALAEQAESEPQPDQADSDEC